MASPPTPALWPLFGLRVTTPVVELRYPDDDLVFAAADLAGQGIHDPSWMPFGLGWTDAPPDKLARTSIQHHWLGRANHTPDSWRMGLAVLRGGELVGIQGLHADEFARLRSVGTGSWLGRRFQGQGIGKEMRQAVLHLIFAGLEARVAVSGAWDDNAPSLGVSRACGYEENGDGWKVRRGERSRMVDLILTRERWEERRRDDIEIHGLDACLDLLVGA